MKAQEETQEEIKKEKKSRKPRTRKEKYDRIPKLITPLENVKRFQTGFNSLSPVRRPKSLFSCFHLT